jgi:hypothetical protein
MNHSGKTAPVNDVHLRYTDRLPLVSLAPGGTVEGALLLSIERGVPYTLRWEAGSIAVTKTVVLRP